MARAAPHGAARIRIDEVRFLLPVALTIFAVTGIAALAISAVFVTLAPPASVLRDPWKAMRRPLHVPKLVPGSPCPTSPTQPASSLASAFSGSVLGRGPVYAGAFSSDAVVRYDPARPNPPGWYGFKVLWIVRPSYRGRVLIRGRQLDGPSRVRFKQGSELRISLWGSSSTAPGWGSAASTEWVRGPGCFGFQIDGKRFSRILVFRAEPAS